MEGTANVKNVVRALGFRGKMRVFTCPEEKFELKVAARDVRTNLAAIETSGASAVDPSRPDCMVIIPGTWPIVRNLIQDLDKIVSLRELVYGPPIDVR